ncbi:MAG: S-layer homology domain-containing protein [Clostridiales bacterium]|jgi:hypothetical protein|nr:S-layer homology domain-containing protein [Clostridiales bacterium]
MKKIIILSALSVLLAGFVIMPAVRAVPSYADKASAEFADVAAGDWFAEPVGYLAEHGIVRGYFGNFLPADNISRADFLVMAMRALDVEITAGIPRFSDVGNDDYYATYVATAHIHGIVSGNEDGTFAPNAPVSRQDMYVILYNLLDFKDKLPSEQLSTADFREFEDSADVQSYAVEAVDALVRGDILHGMDNRLNMREMSTRAQAAQLIFNTL